MNVRATQGSAARRKATGPKGVPFDAAAYEAIERFARVMTRCGYKTNAVVEAFGRALAANQREIHRIPRTTYRELPEAPHLVTLWCSSPDYVDEHGIPYPLPVRGPGRSLETLVRRVSR